MAANQGMRRMVGANEALLSQYDDLDEMMDDTGAYVRDMC